MNVVRSSGRRKRRKRRSEEVDETLDKKKLYLSASTAVHGKNGGKVFFVKCLVYLLTSSFSSPAWSYNNRVYTFSYSYNGDDRVLVWDLSSLSAYNWRVNFPYNTRVCMPSCLCTCVCISLFFRLAHSLWGGTGDNRDVYTWSCRCNGDCRVRCV